MPLPIPPTDLLVAMLAMTTVAIGAGAGVLFLLRSRFGSSRLASATAAVAVGLLIVHAFWLNGNPALARLVRSPNAIVWANFSPIFAAVLVAAAWRAMPVRWQRWMVAIVLSTIALVQAYGPIFGRVPATREPRVIDGVHHQSTLSTCSAAAAATLLGTYGIDTNEGEMAQLCLTRESGTLQLGLYRGLRLKAPDATVEFLNEDFEALLTSPSPAIVSFGEKHPKWQLWQPRVGHSVVVLGRQADGQLLIADPMTGGTYPMPPDELRRLWTGEALRIHR